MRRDGRLVFADETRLEHAGAASSAGRWERARAPWRRSSPAPNIKARLPDFAGGAGGAGGGVEAGASAFDGLIVARLVSPSPPRLRAALIAAIVALGGRKPRLWG